MLADDFGGVFSALQGTAIEGLDGQVSEDLAYQSGRSLALLRQYRRVAPALNPFLGVVTALSMPHENDASSQTPDLPSNFYGFVENLSANFGAPIVPSSTAPGKGRGSSGPSIIFETPFILLPRSPFAADSPGSASAL
jgi:hypothetical protein